ncbi:MAG TPA: EAL domain-containing protein [Nevskiaceae bacterium]|nr:EAL domain-containing protein [Nevskiaceae bacterium]
MDRRLQLAARAADVQVWEWTVATGELWWNDAAAEQLDLEPGTKPSYEAWLACVHPDDRELARRMVDEAVADPGRHDCNFEFRLRRRNGEIRWMRTRAVIVRDSAGTAVSMIGADVDITDLRALIAARDEQATLAWSLFDQSPIGAMVLGLDGCIERSNASFQQLLGYNAAQLQGMSVETLTAPGDLAMTRQRMRELGQGRGEPTGYEKRYLARDGRPVPVRVHTACLHVGGKPWKLIGLVTDLSTERASRQQLHEMSERLQLATAGQGVGVWDLDIGDWSLRLDEASAALFDLDARERVSFSQWLARLHVDDQAELQATVRRLLESNEGLFEMEFRVLRADGALRWVHSSGRIVRDAAGKALRAVGLNRDVSTVHRQLEEMQLQATAMNAASNAMIITDRNGHIVWVNQAFSRITGYRADEAIGQTPRLFKSGHQSAEWYRSMWATISAGQVWRGRIVNRAKDGTLLDIEQTITPVRDVHGKIGHFVSVHEDVTEQVRSEQRIHQLAMVDGVTGLPNRNAFQQHVTNALARAQRSGRPLAVMLLDLDHFKHVNDTLGHAAGDQLLAEVGQRLRAQLREGDFAARLGGDEFALLAEDVTQPKQAMLTAERVLKSVREPYQLAGHAAHVGASIGITLSQDGATGELLLKQADLAMYQAKTRGRDRFRFFDGEMDAEARRRFELESALRAALQNDRLTLMYQPQFDLRSGQLTGMEALLRWTDPEHGAVSPAEFVPLAEQCGLGVELGRWVLHHALLQAGEWKRLGRHVPVAVNTNAQQFEQADFYYQVESGLRACGLDSDDIEIEITESVMLQNSRIVQQNVQCFREAGIKLAVDDFGTGYSSLVSLRDYPVSRLKIDQSFVRGIGGDGKDERIVRAVLALARSLDLHVIAEGVETESQERFLRGEGCQEVQGFRYARPLSAEAMLSLLETGRAAPYVGPALPGAPAASPPAAH